MNDENQAELVKQIIELKGTLKDAALRVRTGLDNQTVATTELTQQMKVLNLSIERLCNKT